MYIFRPFKKPTILFYQKLRRLAIMKKYLFVLILIVTLLISACSPDEYTGVAPVDPSDTSVVDTQYVKPESDNSYDWNRDARIEVSTTVYEVTVLINDEIVNHTEAGATGSGFAYGGIGSMSYRMWQDGKGLLPVTVIKIIPLLDSVPNGSYIILKTSDLKAMALPTGAQTTFICNLDTEVLSPVKDYQVLTTDRLTYELDACRMILPVYILPGSSPANQPLSP